MDLLGNGEDDDDDDDPRYAALQDQFESLNGQFAQNQEFTNNLLTQLVAAQSQNSQGGNGAPEEINFDDLPDPVEDRAGFNKELGTRIGKMMDQTRQQTTQASQNDGQLAMLESNFRRDFAELAEKPALFQTVLTERVRNIRARGLDPKAVVFAQPDKFLKEVAEQMYDELGLDPDDIDDDDDEPGQGGKRKVQMRKKPATRTRGLGRRSGDASLKLRKRNKGDDKPKGFLDQLKATQLDNGLL